MTEIRFTSWNQGELFDYRNVLLRQGKTSQAQEVLAKHAAVKLIFEQKEAEFALRPESEKCKWWERPTYNVTEDEKVIIGNDRKEKLTEIYKKLFANSDLILLQELNTPEDIQFLRGQLPENFNFAYGKEYQQYKGDRTDTAVIWNNRRFTKIENADLSTRNITELAKDSTPTTNRETVTNNRRATYVALKDLQTEKILQVISCHLDGFNLADPQIKSTSLGDKVIETSLETLKKFDSSLTIIGGDFNSEFLPNNEPENNYYENKEVHKITQTRFDTLIDAGFSHVPNSNMTAYNTDIKKLAGRENGLACLDHVFVKGATSSALSDTAQLLPLEDITANPSDHRPLPIEIHY